ncbi:MAG: PH domain-containing protein [Actinobacteria bacterium]|nr:PH domain-containing protein [Actinomycetota bacterium]
MDNSPGDGTPSPSADRDGPSHVWGPDPRLRWILLTCTVAAVIWRILDSDPENRLVAVVLAVVCAVVVLLLIRMRVRLRADAEGIVVAGPLHSRRIAWADIDTISTPRRGRFGRHAAWLELEIRMDADVSTAVGDDAAIGDPGSTPSDRPDTELMTFGAFDLGTDPAKVGRALLRLRRG